MNAGDAQSNMWEASGLLAQPNSVEHEGGEDADAPQQGASSSKKLSSATSSRPPSPRRLERNKRPAQTQVTQPTSSSGPPHKKGKEGKKEASSAASAIVAQVQEQQEKLARLAAAYSKLMHEHVALRTQRKTAVRALRDVVQKDDIELVKKCVTSTSFYDCTGDSDSEPELVEFDHNGDVVQH